MDKHATPYFRELFLPIQTYLKNAPDSPARTEAVRAYNEITLIMYGPDEKIAPPCPDTKVRMINVGR